VQPAGELLLRDRGIRLQLNEGPGRYRGQTYGGGGLVDAVSPEAKRLDHQYPQLLGTGSVAEPGNEAVAPGPQSTRSLE
jgi:hypothetical protein